MFNPVMLVQVLQVQLSRAVVPPQHLCAEVGHKGTKRGGKVVGRSDLLSHLFEGDIPSIAWEDA